MAFCTNCGIKIKGSSKFCPDCGASVEEGPKTSGAASAPGPTPYAGTVPEKALPMPRRNYKAVGIAALAVLAVVILRMFFSQGTGGGKEDGFLEQIQGYWDKKGIIATDATVGMTFPGYIGITENAVQLDAKLYTCPMSETEYKDGALYFSAQWYQSLPHLGQEAGMQDYALRLVYDKSSDLLTLEIEIPAGLSVTTLLGEEYETSGGWCAIGEYVRAD